MLKKYIKILKDLSEKLKIDVDLELVTPKIVANLFAEAKKIKKNRINHKRRT